MWRLDLEASVYIDAAGGVMKHRVWAIEVNRRPVVVREITSAADWVEFVLSHPCREGELLFPDWLAVARDYDAVHMTLRGL
jgi:hypothetical protein